MPKPKKVPKTITCCRCARQLGDGEAAMVMLPMEIANGKLELLAEFKAQFGDVYAACHHLLLCVNCQPGANRRPSPPPGPRIIVP